MENKTHHRVGGAPPSNSSPTTATTSPAPTTSKAAAETPHLGPRRRATGVKRKANNSNYSSSTKRSRGKSFTPLPHINHNHNGPITRARQSPNKAAVAAAAAAAEAAGGSASSSSYAVSIGVSAVGVLDKPSEPLLHSTPPGSAIGEVTTDSLNLIVSEEDRNEALEPNIDAEFEAIRSRDSNVHVIPTPAAWFSWTKVHPIEERALPSFFNGKSENRNSDIYMEIRNSIMKKFHSDPKTQIELKDLSELSAGELNAKQEVLEFLDHWGLINFHPFPAVASDTVETNTVVSFKAAQDKLYQFEVATSWSLEDPKVGLSTQAMPPQLIPESSIAEEVRPEGPSVEYHCNSCSADCSRKRYHCQKQADFDLCSECYNNGKFDSGMSPADFILMEPAEVPGVSGGSWTDQETLLLLEALELFGENWNEIAEHVATKSKAQCILHFVQMPIEDSFLEGKDDFDASHQENTGSGLIDEDSSALKETIETTENKSASNNDLSSLKESHETMERNAMINGPSSLNKSLELAESRSVAKDRPVSPKVDVSDPRDGAKIKADQEISTNYAINVLKEAFQAVGSEESFAFADAGNPVMALAAFLAGLVKPDTAAASARSSVKAASEESPGIQLALRHCIILENPLEDLKETPSSESADIEMLDLAAKKDGFKSQKDEFEKEQFHAQSNVLGEAKIDMEMLDVEAHKDDDNQKDQIPNEPSPLQNYVSVETQKDKDQKEDEFQVHDETKCLDGIDVTKDCTNKKLDDTVTKETAVPVSLPDQSKVNSATTETADVIKMKDFTPGTMNQLNDSALPGKEQFSTNVVNKEICAAKELDALDSKDNVAPCDAKEPDDVTNKDNVVSHASKEPDDGVNKEDVASCAAKEPDDVANEVDVASCVVKEPDDVTNKKDVAPCASKEPDGVTNEDVASGTMNESNDLLMLRKNQHQPSTIDGLNDLALPSEVASSSVEASQIPKVSNDVDMDSGTVHSESKDPQRTVTPSLAIETGANTGDCGSKMERKTEKACDFSEAIGENNVDKIKRAALSALSAAAVKAKLLADEEEMQIRRLSTNLIHKQLHKIETKLAFYAEMENAITRAKEQMDRSRQKLYHERAQIIAARLGLPATSSRAMPSSLPINRVAMGYANAVPKSLPNMNSQNSSVTPITNISVPHVSSVSGAAPGSSTRSSR